MPIGRLEAKAFLNSVLVDFLGIDAGPPLAPRAEVQRIDARHRCYLVQVLRSLNDTHREIDACRLDNTMTKQLIEPLIFGRRHGGPRDSGPALYEIVHGALPT